MFVRFVVCVYVCVLCVVYGGVGSAQIWPGPGHPRRLGVTTRRSMPRSRFTRYKGGGNLPLPLRWAYAYKLNVVRCCGSPFCHNI